ncbi:MAG: 2-hydroxycyclohexanecarboxyl-CoA dehydrogenase [Thermoleophilaceae bacterium]|jgi:2-hydroxycyclohexanecarboxyl-CoA dehydrogenase|nr:2-hydroxycyclohexanecarboxyl-CoA dehydrogenase [Thermoleophilaceae bacterium]
MTALVTGGARGIGRSIALALAEDGHDVAVADLLTQGAEKTADMARAAGAGSIAVTMDITDTAQVIAGVARVNEELGPIDVLVNNAGWDELKPFVDTDEEFWDKVIDINFKGCLRVTHAVLPGMLERGRGSIVNLSSDAGRVGSSLESVYAGAKGAVIAFTKTIAREAASKGVRANVVCPGPTETALLKGIADAAPDAEKVIAAMTRAVPMKRLGQPEDVAGAVAFLCSDRAAFVTGQTLSVSGGLTMA